MIRVSVQRHQLQISPQLALPSQLEQHKRRHLSPQQRHQPQSQLRVRWMSTESSASYDFFFIALTTAANTTNIVGIETISAEDYVNACKQPVAIGTALVAVAVLPLHLVGMFMILSKAEKLFNPARIRAAARAAQLTQKLR